MIAEILAAGPAVDVDGAIAGAHDAAVASDDSSVAFAYEERVSSAQIHLDQQHAVRGSACG